MIDQTNDADELLELIQRIQNQHQEQIEKYNQINENLLKNISLNEVFKNEKLMKELTSLEVEIHDTEIKYQELIKYSKEKCSQIIWKNFKI